MLAQQKSKVAQSAKEYDSMCWVQEGRSSMEAVVTRVLLGNPDEALDMLRTAERQGDQG